MLAARSKALQRRNGKTNQPTPCEGRVMAIHNVLNLDDVVFLVGSFGIIP